MKFITISLVILSFYLQLFQITVFSTWGDISCLQISYFTNKKDKVESLERAAGLAQVYEVPQLYPAKVVVRFKKKKKKSHLAEQLF